MTYLLDTGYFYALLNQAESRHEDVLAASRQVEGPVYLPTPVITEVAYLLLRDVGSEALAEFTLGLADPGFLIVDPVVEDYRRAAEIIRRYHDARVDFADAMLVAIAERLGITRILTLDQRHFRLVRPNHCPAFDLIP